LTDAYQLPHCTAWFLYGWAAVSFHRRLCRVTNGQLYKFRALFLIGWKSSGVYVIGIAQASGSANWIRGLHVSRRVWGCLELPSLWLPLFFLSYYSNSPRSPTLSNHHHLTSPLILPNRSSFPAAIGFLPLIP